MAVASSLKLSLTGYLEALPAPFSSKTPSARLIPLRLSTSSSSSLYSTSFALSLAKKVPLVVSLVARTSDWARQGKEVTDTGAGEENLDWENEPEEFGLLDVEQTEAGFSDLEGEDEEGLKGGGDFKAVGDSPANGEFLEGIGDSSFPEPPEEAKLFVGNLPYDVDSEKLAHLFEKAGIVEVAEVIYNRETGQSRGFGFVNMSNVEEAQKAMELFNRYDCNGRLLTVNIASPRGSLPEKPRREFEPSVRIYVGNLPWQVDDSGLEQIFSQHGEVVNARVVYDRETGRSRGFGFVTMASKRDHENAIEALDGKDLDGRPIRVNVAEERPRRGSF
ncbi:hypothetical protein KSP40_PGU005652 [Platanthera guangdongensis]|uniref:RRM domain-containing protein n=1 Tax=Platanthera guangdongensis TaxID=2320717 RepID=A0ABR2LCS8_9ASPA